MEETESLKEDSCNVKKRIKGEKKLIIQILEINLVVS